MNTDNRTTKVLRCICAAFDVRMEDLLSNKRQVDIIKARHAAYKILFMVTKKKVAVGRILDRHHTAVCDGMKEFDNLYSYNKRFRRMANIAMQEIIKLEFNEVTD